MCSPKNGCQRHIYREYFHIAFWLFLLAYGYNTKSVAA